MIFNKTPPALGTFLYDAAVTSMYRPRIFWQVTSTGPSGRGYTFNLTWVSLTTARLDWILLARRLMSCVMISNHPRHWNIYLHENIDF